MPRSPAALVLATALLGALVAGTPTAVAAPRAVVAHTTTSSAPPGAPVGLTVVKDDQRHTATVRWQPPISEGGAALTDYLVESNGRFASGGSSTVLPPSARSTTLVLLTPGRTYSVTVRARSLRGEGLPATATVSMSRLPDPPRQVTATTATATTGTLRWKAPRSSGGAPVIRYEVGLTTPGSYFPYVIQHLPPTARSATVSGLWTSMTSVLSVRAVTAAGRGAYVGRSVVPVPDAELGRQSFRDVDVRVDPSGRSLVVVERGQSLRFTFPKRVSCVIGFGPVLGRSECVRRLTGHHRLMLVDYQSDDEGVVQHLWFTVSGTDAHPAPTGHYREQWDDYGVDLVVDPGGRSLVLAGTGGDPGHDDEVYAQLPLRFPLSELSTYRYSVDDHRSGLPVTTDFGQVSREDFVELLAANQYIYRIEFRFDAVSGTGSFVVEGAIGFPGQEPEPVPAQAPMV